ncbi:DUF2992 family protein [Virgibacillus sp. NKC19-3]|nr:DUF2992 family protein [Virgibacillus sp. NKC19-3]MBY7141875.1 DUF2992 family protein [Virgibacillus sp. NKC19-3]
MILTVYFDGQFWVGVIELRNHQRLKAYRYVFDPDPSDPEVLEFVNHHLIDVIDKGKQVGIKYKRKPRDKKIILNVISDRCPRKCNKREFPQRLRKPSERILNKIKKKV